LIAADPWLLRIAEIPHCRSPKIPGHGQFTLRYPY
jgi:hypothetical protein